SELSDGNSHVIYAENTRTRYWIWQVLVNFVSIEITMIKIAGTHANVSGKVQYLLRDIMKGVADVSSMSTLGLSG
ncbi:hypothetical protein ACJX0J_013333, partial [Zea mays]